MERRGWAERDLRGIPGASYNVLKRAIPVPVARIPPVQVKKCLGGEAPFGPTPVPPVGVE